MVKRKDLVDITDPDYLKRRGEVMLCICGFEIGGTRGDFWRENLEHIMSCPVCGSKELTLVRKEIKYVPVHK
jgi:hypothetical protein